MKPGIKTTEFWITLVVVLAGLLPSSGLLPEGHWVVKVCGLVVSVAAAMGYTVARTKAKALKALLPLFFLPLLALGGCCKGHISAEAIEPAVRLVTSLHDRMLIGDVDPRTISQEDKATYLRTSQLLRETVREAVDN